MVYDLKLWDSIPSTENTLIVHTSRNLSFAEQITAVQWVPGSDQELVFATLTGKAALVNVNQRGALSIFRRLQLGKSRLLTTLQFNECDKDWLLIYNSLSTSVLLHCFP